MNDLDAWVVNSPVFGWLVAHTYPVVFVGTLVDASGLPFPGRLLLVAAGALTVGGRRSVVVVIAIAAAAAIVMDHVWYVAGARGATGILRLYRQLSGYVDGDGDAAAYVGRSGAASIVLGRFFTSIRALVWPVAARHGVTWSKFLVFDAFAASLWASIWVLLGWMVADRWRSAAESAGGWLAIGGVIVLAVAVRPIVMRLARRRRQH